MNEKWFMLRISQIEKKLKTNAASGLSRKAARSAWRIYSQKAGFLFVKKHKSAHRMLLELISDFSLVLLLILSVLSILFGDIAMGATVLSLSCIGILLNFFFYFKTQKNIEKIECFFSPTAKVIRGGRLYRISFDNVVPGDVVLLEKGDIVCGDARIVTSDNLSVSMRLDKNKFFSLKKHASGIISENENNPCKHVNILHAGSIIEEGSARAIIYATGKYTYLGALTGGIIENSEEEIPNELKKIKKICSSISIYSMIGILPFSILSLLFSHIDGGTSTLSTAFLTALAIASSSMSQLTYTCFKFFYVKKMTTVADGKSSVAIRSTDTIDKLSNLKYIFMLDGCAVTDGILHFDTAFNADGEIKNYIDNATLSPFYEAVALYRSSEKNFLTIGVGLPNRFQTALDEFSLLSTADVEALKIRCPIKSYVQGNETYSPDKIFYTDVGRSMVLSVSHTEDILSLCQYTYISGQRQSLTASCTDRIRHTFNMHKSQGKKVLIFTVSSLENDVTNFDRCFIGALVFSEAIDNNTLSSIRILKKYGIRIISFVPEKLSKNTPHIPIELQQGNIANYRDFINSDYPVTYRFGDIDTYYGFDDKAITALITFIQKEKKEHVGVIAFSEYYSNSIKQADVFISCASTVNIFKAKSERELYELELEGGKAGFSCHQTVRKKSDVLINRPKNGRGGISLLIKCFSCFKSIYRNISAFFKYIIGMFILRVCIAGIPMVLGNPILDARHILLFSTLFDVALLLLFALDNSGRGNAQQNTSTLSLKGYISTNANFLISVIISAISALLLPLIADYIGIMGAYLYRTEYLFCAMLWLQIAMLYYIRFLNIRNFSKSLKDKKFLSIIAAMIFVCVILFVVTPLGRLFDIERNPLPYFVLSLLPVCIFAMSISVVKLRSKK